MPESVQVITYSWGLGGSELRQDRRVPMAHPDEIKVYVADDGVVSCYEDGPCFGPGDDDRWTFAAVSGRRHTFGELVHALTIHVAEEHDR